MENHEPARALTRSAAPRGCFPPSSQHPRGGNDLEVLDQDDDALDPHERACFEARRGRDREETHDPPDEPPPGWID